MDRKIFFKTFLEVLTDSNQALQPIEIASNVYINEDWKNIAFSLEELLEMCSKLRILIIVKKVLYAGTLSNIIKHKNRNDFIKAFEKRDVLDHQDSLVIDEFAVRNNASQVRSQLIPS